MVGRSRRTAALALLLLTAACADSPRAPGATPSAEAVPFAPVVDSIIGSWVESGRIPGAILRVTRGDAVLHERAYGWAHLYDFGAGQYPAARATDATTAAASGLRRLAEPVPMTPGTRFDLASVTKVMATTMAVMLLVDRGVLDLDAPVSTWLPDFTGGGREQITARHLLTHRSGLPQWLPVYYHASDADAAYRYLRTVPLSWPVGAERHYSDLGFMILGRIVGAASGASLDAFLRRELYGPLGLTRTGFRGGGSPSGGDAGPSGSPAPGFAATSHGNPFERRMVHDPDFGYRIEGDPDAWDGWRTYTLSGEVNDGNAHHAFRGEAGHAGLFSTASELSVLLRLLVDGGVAGGRRVVSVETVEAFLAPTGDDQALGWQLPPYAPAGSFGHTGFTGTFVLGVPALDLAVVLLTNRQNVGVDEETQYPDVGALQRAVTAALTASGPS